MSELREIVDAAIVAARRYKQLTGKPLGITGEIGEVLAAQLLGLTLADARQEGFDATDADGRRIQIKARCLPATAKPGQRVGAIKLDYPWDVVLLVLMSDDYEPLEIWEADRAAIQRELERPGSKARGRGALGVRKFKSIARMRWTRGDPPAASR